jgi:hypothetical protein
LLLSADVIKRVEEQMEIEYVYNSNRIEGSTLSRGETALVLKGMTVNHQNLPDVLAARNHPGGMKLIQGYGF